MGGRSWMQNREAQYLPHVFGSQVPHGQLDLVLFVVSIRSLDDHGDVVGRHCSSFKACIHKCVGPLRLRSLRLSSRSPGGMLHRNTLGVGAPDRHHRPVLAEHLGGTLMIEPTEWRTAGGVRVKGGAV